MQLRPSQLDALAPQHLEAKALANARRFANDQPGAHIDEATATVVVPRGSQHDEVAQFGPHGILNLHTPEDRRFSFDYDERGRLTLLQVADLPAYRFVYDSKDEYEELYREDKLLLRVNAPGNADIIDVQYPDNTLERLFYQQDLLVKTENGAGEIITLDRDEQGRVTAVTDARGSVTRYEFQDPDPWGVTIINPNGVREVWQSEQDIITVQVADQLLGQAFPTDYGRCAQYADGHRIEVAFDGDRPTGGKNDEIEVRFDYDGDGNCTSEQQGQIALAYAYDQLGNLTEIATSDGQQIRFSYDLDGIISTIEDNRGAIFRFEYRQDGVLAKLIYPNTIRLQGGYAATAEGGEIDYHLSGPAFPSPISFERTQFDLRVRVTRQALFDQQSDFQYDPAGRLSQVDDRASGRSLAISWDPASNRVNYAGVSATFDAANQILSQGGETFTHDIFGRLISRSDPLGITRYYYNGQGHLIATQLPNGRRIEYAYDAFGRRMRMVIDKRVTHFLWAGQLLLREWTLEDEREIERRDYLYVPGEYHHPLAVRINGALYCYHNDHRGTPIAMTDEQGNLVWRASYGVFGELLQQEGRIRQPLRHLGQYQDEETGLYYNVFRYYDPGLGRYLTPDPLRFCAGNPNFCVYADADPVNYRDPNGHLIVTGTVLTAIAVGAVIGGVAKGAIGFATAKKGEGVWEGIKGFGLGALGGAVAVGTAKFATAYALGKGAILALNTVASIVTSAIEACVDQKGWGNVGKQSILSGGASLLTGGLLGKIFDPIQKKVEIGLGRLGSRILNPFVGREFRKPIIDGVQTIFGGWVGDKFGDYMKGKVAGD